MNEFTIKFNFAKKLKKASSGEKFFNDEFINAVVKRISSFNYDKKNFFFDQKNDILCAMIGNIINLSELRKKYNLEKQIDVEVVSHLYSKYGLKFIESLDGLFIIFIYNKKSKKGYIFGDCYGPFLPLYLTKTGDGFIASISLKTILKEIPKNKRKLNYSAVRDLLSCKVMVPNKNTLVKNIYKLIPNSYLYIDYYTNKIKVVRIERKKHLIPEEFAKQNLIKSIKDNVINLQKNLSSHKITCAVSGGFDSNLLAFYLAKDKKAKIAALTIGGSEIDESSQARALVKDYKNVKHYVSFVKKSQLENLPKIVWRLESYVCERGIFLQYELAHLCWKLGNKTIFLGELADQILNQNREPSEVFYLKYFNYGNIVDENKNNRLVKYDVMFDYILKKSTIMLNSFGLQGVYPYINKNTYQISSSLKKINLDKAFFKEEVERILGKRKSRYLKKTGGSTDIIYLFEEKKEEIEMIFKSDLVRSILKKNEIKSILNSYNEHTDLILLILNIYLFNCLFISGKYDSDFDNQFFKYKLEDLL